MAIDPILRDELRKSVDAYQHSEASDLSKLPPVKPIGKTLLVWVVANHQYHDILCHYPQGCLLVTQFPPTISGTQTNKENYSLPHVGSSGTSSGAPNIRGGVEWADLALSHVFLNAGSGVVLCGSLSDQCKRLLGLQDDVTNPKAVGGGGDGQTNDAMGDYLPYSDSTTSKAKEDAASSSRGSSPLGLHLATKAFEFHLLESELSPIDKDTIQDLTADWNANILCGKMQPFRIPVVFYVADNRHRLWNWDIAGIQRAGLGWSCDFQLQTYIGTRHLLNETDDRGHQLRVATGGSVVSTPLSEVVTLQTPLGAMPLNSVATRKSSKDLYADTLECPLSIRSSTDNAQSPSLEASTFLDHICPHMHTLGHGSEIRQAYRILARYDVNERCDGELSRFTSLAAKEGPFATLLLSLSMPKRAAANRTAAETIMGVSSSSTGEEFFLQPALNIRHLVAQHLDCAAVVIRAARADTAKSCLFEMASDLQFLQSLSTFLASEAHSDALPSADALQTFFQHSLSMLRDARPDVRGGAKAQSSGHTTNFRAKVQTFLESQRPEAQMWRQSATTGSQANDKERVELDVGEGANPLSPSAYVDLSWNADQESSAQNSTVRPNADFVDRLWAFIRCNVADFAELQILFTGMHDALAPSHRAGRSLLSSGGVAMAGRDTHRAPLLLELRSDTSAAILSRTLKLATRICQLERYGGVAARNELTALTELWKSWREFCDLPLTRAALLFEIALDSLSADAVHVLQQNDSSIISSAPTESNMDNQYSGADTAGTDTARYEHSDAHIAPCLWWYLSPLSSQDRPKFLDSFLSNAKDCNRKDLTTAMAEHLSSQYAALGRLRRLHVVCEYVLLAAKSKLPFDTVRRTIRHVLDYYRTHSEESRPLFVLPIAGYAAKCTAAWWTQSVPPCVFYLERGSCLAEFHAVRGGSDRDDKTEEKGHSGPSKKSLLKTHVCQASAIGSNKENALFSMKLPKYDVQHHSHEFMSYSVNVVHRHVVH